MYVSTRPFRGREIDLFWMGLCLLEAEDVGIRFFDKTLKTLFEDRANAVDVPRNEFQ